MCAPTTPSPYTSDGALKTLTWENAVTGSQVTTLGVNVDDAVRRISNTYDDQQRIKTVTSASFVN